MAETDWKEALPETLRVEPSLRDIKDVASLAKSYIEGQALRGRSLTIPGPDAGDDARAEFRAKLRERVPELVELPADPEKRKAVEPALWDALGRPKDAKEYLPQKVDGVEFSDAEVAQMRQAAQKRGYTKAQFQQLVADAAEAKAIQAKSVADMKAALKAEWGSAYEERAAEVAGLLEKSNAPAELRQAIKDGRIDSGTATWLASLAKSLGAEPRSVAQDPGGHRGTMTPAEAHVAIDEIFANKQHPFWNQRSPAHPAAKARMLELQGLANPTASRDIGQLRSGGSSR